MIRYKLQALNMLVDEVLQRIAEEKRLLKASEEEKLSKVSNFFEKRNFSCGSEQSAKKNISECVRQREEEFIASRFSPPRFPSRKIKGHFSRKTASSSFFPG